MGSLAEKLSVPNQTLEGAFKILNIYEIGSRMVRKDSNSRTYYTLKSHEEYLLQREKTDPTQLILFPWKGDIYFQFCDREIKGDGKT